jgi:hypothetical protein
MLRLPHILGVFIGLSCAALLLSSMSGRQSSGAVNCEMMSECDGALREIVVQYTSGAQNVVPVYREFLPLLAPDVVVDVIVPDASSFNELRSALPATSCTLHPIIVNHPMTAWSRDRWVALLPAHAGDPTTLLAPSAENAADTWPARAGDQRIAADLAAALSPRIAALRSGLEFDGGDLLCDGEHIFATSAVLHRNLNRTVASRDELVRTLEDELHRRVILMDDSPDHHAGMFMMAAADRTMLIADPRMAFTYTVDLSSLSCAQTSKFVPNVAMEQLLATLPGGPDFSEQTQQRLDAIADQCQALGLRVVRIPTIPAMDRKTYLTYLNVITEVRDGHRIVYMPVYRGADRLNDAAERAWRQIGYDVKRIDCTSTYQCFGNLHCLVNVLARG